MNVLGIIAEYNPFHNGHLHHLEKSKELCASDAVVCVMSGNFIQRGEPAVADKWARAEMALKCGIDLVIELPMVYAMSSAEFFAFGAVKILDSLGIVDEICFGSESGDIDVLDRIADVLVREPDEYRSHLRLSLAKGHSFPAAREEALDMYFKSISSHGIDICKIIDNSNNILGIEYLKALKKLGSKIRPFTIERIASTYNSEKLEGSISSATAIRNLVKSSYPHDIVTMINKMEDVLPPQSVQILEREFSMGRGPVFAKDFEVVILSKLREMSVEEIAELPGISEGLENRMKSAAGVSGSLDELLENISTKRYTRTRIQRCLFGMLAGLNKKDFSAFSSYGGPQYARVLGFNQTGRKLLSIAGKSSKIPVIVKAADFKNSSNPLLSRMLQLETASTDQYVLSFRSKEFRKSGQEFTHNIMRF